MREVMSFNKMRKLTKSPEQVLKAIIGSTLVEASPDKKMLRKIGISTSIEEALVDEGEV